MATAQPIIRGIQAVGSVMVYYKYNGNGNKLSLNTDVMRLNGDSGSTEIDTSTWVSCAGFRLDSTFLEANPQIASSFMIPILGGGAVALTNNNRSGVLNISTTRVSTPSTDSSTLGAMEKGTNTSMGPLGTDNYYDLTLLLQAQQGQAGGDSAGADIRIVFAFNNKNTVVTFEGCTVASIRPLALSGNDAVDYAASINYLNWTVNYSTGGSTFEANS